MEQITKKLKSWASILEPKTRAQAARMSSMDFIDPHMALMPDAHLGKGACVGSVIPTRGAIIPAAVGVDIGCGMIAHKTQFTLAEVVAKGGLTPLREAIEKSIPLSAGNYNKTVAPSSNKRLDDLTFFAAKKGFKPADYAPNWELQLGTLGSGNHFIEVSIDRDNAVWLFLHSGSRGVGNKIAQYHIGVAQKQCQGISLPEGDRDLAYLTEGTAEFQHYIDELTWAQGFALLNREEMMERVTKDFSAFMGEPVRVSEAVNCHHNYTERISDGVDTTWLSRKGAINAELGKPGLIPGSMGTRSYVVEGKGNAEALNSAPHGAGRNFSRGQAKKTFTMDDLEVRMQGIEWRHTDKFLDEHPDAYKDIDIVMSDAADLVSVKYEFSQILNVKGD